MTLRRLIAAHRLIQRQHEILRDQSKLITAQNDELRRIHLEHAREMRGIVCGWIISLERPDVDLRDDLFDLDRQLANRVATLEEHVI